MTTHGGKRPGAGPPPGRKNPNAGRMVRWIELSEDDARTMRILLSTIGKRGTKEEIERYVSGLIREQWQAYDAMIQEKAAELAEVEPCVNA